MPMVLARRPFGACGSARGKEREVRKLTGNRAYSFLTGWIFGALMFIAGALTGMIDPEGTALERAAFSVPALAIIVVSGALAMRIALRLKREGDDAPSKFSRMRDESGNCVHCNSALPPHGALE